MQTACTGKTAAAIPEFKIQRISNELIQYVHSKRGCLHCEKREFETSMRVAIVANTETHQPARAVPLRHRMVVYPQVAILQGQSPEE